MKSIEFDSLSCQLIIYLKTLNTRFLVIFSMEWKFAILVTKVGHLFEDCFLLSLLLSINTILTLFLFFNGLPDCTKT